MVVNCQNVILEILDFFTISSTGWGAPRLFFFFCTCRAALLRVLRSWPSLCSVPFRSLHFAPLCYARATNHATAKARLTLTSSAPPCGLRRLHGYTPPTWHQVSRSRQPCIDSNFYVTGVYLATSYLKKQASCQILEGVNFCSLDVGKNVTFFFVVL